MRHEHLPAYIVADYLEGLLGPGEAAEAERKLAACSDCAAIREEVAVVRAALAADVPEPMPASVAARVEAALARAAADRASEGSVRTSATRRSGTREGVPSAAAAARPGSMSGRRRRWLPAIGTAVAMVVVAIGAAAIYPEFANHDQNESGSEAALSGRVATPQPDSAGAGGAESAGPPAAAAGEAPPIVSSGRHYTAYTLSTGVHDLLAETGVGGSSALASDGGQAGEGLGALTSPTTPGAAPVPAELSPVYGRFSDPVNLNACVRTIAGRDVTPIVVDISFYSGRPAAVVVLPDPADATNALVYVVPPTCGAGPTSTLAETTVRRPVTASPSPQRLGSATQTPALPSVSGTP